MTPVESSADGLGESDRPRFGRSYAVLSFAAVCVAAMVFVPLLARHQWFTSDEWDFIGGRQAWSLHDLLRPHNGHWSTLPILEYRALYALFGLRTYLPYQLTMLIVRVAAAVLLRAVMRRAGISPWVATALASFFLFLGTGWQDIIWGFQTGYIGAFAFGLIQLLLADHDGKLDRRDWLGLLAGFAGLLCSGVAVSMVIAVAVAATLRRGWRVAAFHVVPLATVYVLWDVTEARRPNSGPTATGHPVLLLRWMVNAAEGLFAAFGRVNVVTFAFAVLVVAGLVLAWSRLDRAALRTSRVLPIALLVGGVLFVAMTGWTRVVAYHPAYARMSRYVDVSVTLALPAIGIAIDAVIRRWRILAPVLVVAFLAVLPVNVRELRHINDPGWYAIQTPYRRGFVILAEVPSIHDVPRSMRVDDALHILPHSVESNITIGWLLDAKAAGKLPSIRPTAKERSRATIGLLLRQSKFGLSTNCRTLRSAVGRRLNAGDTFAFEGGRLDISGTYPASGNDASSGRIRFDPAGGHAVTAAKGPMTLVLSPVPGPPTKVCDSVPAS